MEDMIFAGVDGCRGGWCVVIYSRGEWRFDVANTWSSVIKLLEKADLILVDIPIGLSCRRISRDVEFCARKFLEGKQKSSIFSVPAREAVYAKSFKEANAINRSINGKGISMQSWNLCPKIKELDQHLHNHPADIGRVREAHPEICFRQLNKGYSLEYSKRTDEGISERLEILSCYYEGLPEKWLSWQESLSSQLLKQDDLMDALCLAFTAYWVKRRGVESIMGVNQVDAKGIPMQMVFPLLKPHENDHEKSHCVN